MLYINCPHCGMRSQNEFSYGGDASVIRPLLEKEVSDKEWDDFMRKSRLAFYRIYFELIQKERVLH